MMTALRNRLVTEQDGHQHVSGHLLADDEIRDALNVEVGMHMFAGWQCQRFGTMLRFQKNGVVRWVWVRSRPPLDDNLDPN